MSENTKPRGCGQREVIGHGQNHFCGDELWGEVVYCDSCNLKAAKARIAELEAALAAMGGEGESVPHPDDVAVDLFASAMKAKLEFARNKGRGGWQDKANCPQQRLSDMLRAHADKGDPVDVANFACFLWNRQEGVLPAATHPEAQGVAVRWEGRNLPNGEWVGMSKSTFDAMQERGYARELIELRVLYTAAHQQGADRG